MSGPCVTDGDCTEFYMDGANLRVDLIISPNANNAASCGIDGLFVQRQRMRYTTGVSSTVIPATTGLSQGFGGVLVDLNAWANNPGTPTLPGIPRDITNSETITYTNTSNATEIVKFEFVQGQTRYVQRAGWDLMSGLKTSWSGPAALVPVSNLRTNSGFGTGGSALDLGWNGTAYADPVGATMPPYILSNTCEVAPSEVLTLTWRLWAQYLAQGLDSVTPGPGYIGQQISISFGSAASIYAWSKG